MSNKQNIPTLRFPEFQGNWNIDKVGKLCDFIVPGRNKPKTFIGNIPWITTPDIEHNGVVLKSKKGLAISKEEAKKVGSKIVPANSIIISCVGELGLAAINGIEMVINQQLHAFIPKDKINNRFLLYSISNQKRFMEKVATKTAVPYMNKDNCNSIPVKFPSIPEQQKIATFLTAVDGKIELLQKKKEGLEKYKKGVMQQIFAQKLRFKPESGNDYPDWEEKKLGEVADITTGSSNRVDSSLDGGEFTFFDRSQDIRTSSIFLFDGEAIIVAGEGQEFIPKYFIGKFDLHQRTYAIMNFKESIGKFLYYLIDKNRHYFYSQAVGSTVKSLRLPMFQKMKVLLPTLKEQTQIANFLSAIDDKIALVNTQLENTQQFKKGLLQQMFV